MIPTTLCAVQPRGTIKAFREHFNGEFAGGKKHKNGVYTQRVRGYGDYLYYQDREKFNFELAAALLAGWHQNK